MTNKGRAAQLFFVFMTTSLIVQIAIALWLPCKVVVTALDYFINISRFNPLLAPLCNL